MFIISGTRYQVPGSIPTMRNPIFFHLILQVLVFLCFFPEHFKGLKKSLLILENL
jgi:hypothetical protein